MTNLRIIIADDERPAREYLKRLLLEFENVELIGEAEDGSEAVELIRAAKPDLALLDLQMPVMTGLEAVRLLSHAETPLIAFVTAFDEYAVKAFELNAIDYLLKPVEKARLAETLQRAHERLNHADWQAREAENIQQAIDTYDETSPDILERIPVRHREEILLVPVAEIASIVADGELLQITTDKRKYVINYRLKDLERRLPSNSFIRLSRGALANLNMIESIAPMPGGTYAVKLKNGQEIASSRVQSKVLRAKLLKL